MLGSVSTLRTSKKFNYFRIIDSGETYDLFFSGGKADYFIFEIDDELFFVFFLEGVLVQPASS